MDGHINTPRILFLGLLCFVNFSLAAGNDPYHAASAGVPGINMPSLPIPAIYGNSNACLGGVGEVYYTANWINCVYDWTVTGGSIISGWGTYQITVSWDSAGIGLLTVVQTDTLTSVQSQSLPRSISVHPRPSAAITGDTAVCANEAGLLYSVIAHPYYHYSWSLKGGTIASGQGASTVTVDWSGGASGQVMAVVTDTLSGCVSLPDTFEVFIVQYPQPIIAGDVDVCEDETFVPYFVQAHPNHQYSWSVAGGVIYAGQGNHMIMVNWGVAGAGLIELTEVALPAGCATVAMPFPVTIHPVPLPLISGTDTVCAFDTTLIYSTPDMLGHAYYWQIDGGVIIQGQYSHQITVNWDSAGQGQVYCEETILSTGCNLLTIPFQVTIHPLPEPAISGLAGLCVNELAVYSVAGIQGDHYQWNVTGGNIISGQGTDSVLVGWPSAGAGNICVEQISGLTGCRNRSDTLMVNVFPLPSPVVAGDPQVCSFDGGMIYSVQHHNGRTYQWFVSGGSIVSGQGSHQVVVDWGSAASGFLLVSETITSTGCHHTSDTFFVNISPYPVPVISGPSSVCSESSGIPYSVAHFSGHQYTWSVTGGSVMSGQSTNSILVKWFGPGQGTVNLQEVSAFGCVAQAVPFSVTIHPLPDPVIVGDPSVCALDSGLTYAVASHAGHAYNWEIEGGVIVSGQNSAAVSVKWGQAGNGWLRVLQTNTITACSKISQVFQLNIYDPPQVQAGSPISIAWGDTAVLGCYHSGGSGVYSYSWSPAALLNNAAIQHPVTNPLYQTTWFSVTVTDMVSGCMASVDSLLVTVAGSLFTLRGYVTYGNSLSSPMAFCIVQLTDSTGGHVASDTADSQGFYNFQGLQGGEYQIEVITDLPWGGGNAVDALLAMRHFVQASILTGLTLKASDVNNDGITNATDAYMIARRYVDLIQSFPAGDWVSEPVDVTLDGYHIHDININVLCVGDINGSFIPVFK